ncbi:MAG: sigma-54 dependent transcriptional regulator [Gammaproteobacteria bacterium]|nr:sigma-54 dependent transcriptional regulator [Gammaproteobacteria bacterium]MBT8056260.1 sigma-54 dependent transcriptional regulator [Gammaproteobacteria bacterium]NNJ79270.1 sigma-54-dependent Fis family transcriptional regulator [Xanthomonadales bacterium]
MSQPYVLVVDDEPDIRELVQEILEDEGYEVAVAENGESARNAFSKRTPDLVLLDIWMPDIDGITLLREWSSTGEPECPVVVMSGHGNLETAVEATRLGAHDFVQKPISLAKLLSIASQAIESGKRHEKPRAATRQVAHKPIGASAVMQVLRGKAEQAAEHELPVLIIGEKGSGRENLARYIHEQSGRSGPLLCADHGELASDRCREYLLGDADREGLLSKASGGSLFIAEIEDLPRTAMKVLLPVLESGQFLRDGENKSQPLDCRIIAGACPQLPERASRDEDLEALYYRLNVLPLEMPPLRERQEDVPELVRFYAEWFPNADELPYRPFSVGAQNRLRNHSWPGNVRELRNLVRQLLVLGGEGEVSAREVDEALKQSPSAASPGAAGHPAYFDLPLREAREQFEREYLVFKLQDAEGSVGKLAETVGMERTHLYRKLRALGIDPRAAARNRK